MFPRSNGAKPRHVIEDQLLYQLLLYWCVKAMSCVFYCSHPVPTIWSVFNKQVGQVRRGCCLISLCSTHWWQDVLCYLPPGLLVAEAQPGHHFLPSIGKQKPMQTSFLLNIASAGWASQEQCWFTKCRKHNKTINILPWRPHKMQWYEPKAIQFPSRQMQVLNDWMCSYILPLFNFLLFFASFCHLGKRFCFMPCNNISGQTH